MYLLTSCLAVDLSKVQVNIPRPRGSDTQHQKALKKFYEQVLAAVKQHINFDVIKCCLIAGPGCIHDEFLKWMLNEAIQRGYTNIVKNKAIFITAKASSAYKQSLSELLSDGVISNRMRNTKASAQVAALDLFYKTLQRFPDKACYGPKQVEYAAEQGAIQTLMVTDGLFRSSNLSTRKKYVEVTQLVKESGAEVHILSDMHVAGEQLSKLSGIAAILRYPMPDIDDIEEAATQEETVCDEEEEETDELCKLSNMIDDDVL